MGIFSRLGTLIKSNLNDLISKAEDPEKMLNQILVDMKNQLVEAKKQVAVAIGDEKRLKKQWDDQVTQTREWERKAMMAVQAGDDDLAKEALVRQKEHEELGAQFEQQWHLQKQAVDKLKDQLRVLNNKIEEAKRKKNILVARAKRAEAQKTIQQTMAGLSDTSAFDTLERMAEKVDAIEAEAEAGSELSGELTGDTLHERFKRLETSGAGTDAQLMALKAKMGMAALPASSTTGSDKSRALPAADKSESGDQGKKPALAAGDGESE